VAQRAGDAHRARSVRRWQTDFLAVEAQRVVEHHLAEPLDGEHRLIKHGLARLPTLDLLLKAREQRGRARLALVQLLLEGT
jgi:hypothetical protein